jgi:hypothetical protein
MKKVYTAFLFVLLSLSAQAQRQTTVVQVTGPVSSPGRHIPPANDLIGAAASYWTYCTTATSLQVIAEESPDSIPAHYVPLSPVYGVPTSVNGNSCGLIQAGGLYGYPAFNILSISGGTITIWYSATVGAVSTFPPANSSSGATSLPVCDQQALATASSGSTSLVITGASGQSIHICGWTLSFPGAAVTGNAILIDATTGTSCATAIHNDWEAYFNSTSQPFDHNIGLVVGPGKDVCITAPGTGGGVEISVSYATY